MSLSLEQKNRIRRALSFSSDEQTAEGVEPAGSLLALGVRVFFSEDEIEGIVNYCGERGIELYNLAVGRLIVQQELFLSFLNIVEGKPSDIDIEEWKQRFDELLVENQVNSRELHRWGADISGTMRDGRILNPTACFTEQDMARLAPGACIIDLAAWTASIVEQLTGRIQAGVDAFIAACDEGHWFSVRKAGNQWVIEDSFAFLAAEGQELTSIQERIKAQSLRLIQTVDPGYPLERVEFTATGKQSKENGYECGTHVVNRCRSLLDEGYQEKSHQELVLELVESAEPVVTQEYKARLIKERTEMISAGAREKVESFIKELKIDRDDPENMDILRELQVQADISEYATGKGMNVHGKTMELLFFEKHMMDSPEERLGTLEVEGEGAGPRGAAYE
ncbi:hypothetical protein PsalMR5_03279 [Piscirickettsia salmonis]|uniref:hypothetical protein n=1 Tax=Piscirickettsia salmonis TaxID=1238 RepID=UPI0012BA5ADF|nr:hypothetical protein [Piscirickettsia salmonis]QGP55814.1 hypothetical protein PsalSR1_03274 [Piscirickettsia salmonis]QGP58318.1 hypothetical protein PsalBI1_00883 [Piscirickettsia salmonis]QGP65383.1 hypothetical protein PsalMR5_03279 [Piscirickettsia salmonis]